MITTLSSLVALLRFPMTQKLICCSSVVNIFALNVLYSCRNCVLILDVVFLCLFLFSSSLFEFVLLGVMMLCKSGKFC